MYHLGPKGGKSGSQCPYDDRGRYRSKYSHITHILGVNVNNIGMEDYRQKEAEGLTFSNENTQNAIHGYELIAGNDYYCNHSLDNQLNKLERNYPKIPKDYPKIQEQHRL